MSNVSFFSASFLIPPSPLNPYVVLPSLSVSPLVLYYCHVVEQSESVGEQCSLHRLAVLCCILLPLSVKPSSFAARVQLCTQHLLLSALWRCLHEIWFEGYDAPASAAKNSILIKSL